MAMSELQRCLDEVSHLFENLQSQNAALRKEILQQKSRRDICGVVPMPSEVPAPDAQGKDMPSLPGVPSRPEATTAKQKTLCSWGKETEWEKSLKTSGGMLGAARLGQLKKAPLMVGENAPLRSCREFLKWISPINCFEREDDARPRLHSFARSTVFKVLCTVGIVANTVYLGVAADLSVKNSYNHVLGQQVLVLDRTPEIIFTAWFTFELLVNFLDQGWDFVLGPAQIFNIFDVFLVANSIVELSVDSIQNLSFLRVFRVFRLVRIVRLVRTVRGLRSLRTMLFSIISSMAALFWAFVVLLLTMFMFSIIFSNGVASYFEQLDVKADEKVSDASLVFEVFGGVYETLVTLFSAVSGGNDWMFYGHILRNGPGEIYFLTFVIYIFFCLIGLLNVVTGIFVDSAVCTRTEDEVVESFTEEQTRLCGEMRRIFKDADMDGNGCITYEEFCEHVEDPWVQAFLSGLDIDITDARIVFTLLDVDGSGALTVEEFVDGAMKLKGPAKGIDMLSMMFDLVRYNLRFSDLCSFLEDQTGEIKDLLTKQHLNRKVQDTDNVESFDRESST